MHEWALAEAVIKTAVKVSKDKNLKEVKKVSIILGELQSIDEETFRFALEGIEKPEGIFKNTNFELIDEKAGLQCKVCGKQWNLAEIDIGDDEIEFIHFIPEVSHIYIKCPACGSRDFEIIKGRGVWIASIEGIVD